MDVIVTPVGSTGTAWNLDDRLGRHLGTICKSDASEPFEIEPVPTSTLHGVLRLHMTLDAAMSAIASRMGGACERDSQDWD
jgi:hypothetical protein